MSDTQVIAARLTAIDLLKMLRCPHDERTGGNDYLLCHQCGLQWDYRKWPDWSAGARDMLAQLVSAHVETLQKELAENRATTLKIVLERNELIAKVETLTQQVAELREGFVKDTDAILWLEKERDTGWQAAAAAADDTKDYFEMADKVKRLDELWSATTVRALQAEQQRDAAHAALREIRKVWLTNPAALRLVDDVLQSERTSDVTSHD
jgi:DNA repair exonuclease SbcCD nuclease subunit